MGKKKKRKIRLSNATEPGIRESAIVLGLAGLSLVISIIQAILEGLSQIHLGVLFLSIGCMVLIAASLLPKGKKRHALAAGVMYLISPILFITGCILTLDADNPASADEQGIQTIITIALVLSSIAIISMGIIHAKERLSYARKERA